MDTARLFDMKWQCPDCLKKVFLAHRKLIFIYFHAKSLMNKKIILNGIELSLPKYDATSTTLFDYLENVVTNLEEELGADDGNFQLSINVDFSTNKPPHHQILSNGKTARRTKEKVARALKRTQAGTFNQVSGSVRVNLQVEDK